MVVGEVLVSRMEFVQRGRRCSGRWKRRRLASAGKALALLCIYLGFFCSACALLGGGRNAADVASETGNSRSTGGGRTDSPLQEGQRAAPEAIEMAARALEHGGQRRRRSVAVSPMAMGGGARRYLAGPGSYPPRCLSKCGSCNPCKPVHVPVPPGTPVIAEYYLEAWRCKCGGKLFMP